MEIKELPVYEDGPFFQCFFCSTTETPSRTLKRCAGCQLVNYCSKDCQLDDWKNHKPICKKFPVVNGKNVYHTTESWENHIAGLHKQAAQLTPKTRSITAKQIFAYPKVCKTCHEAQPDRLKVCKCNVFCYCSKECANKDNAHMKSCTDLSKMMKSSTSEVMKLSYPASFWSFLQELMKSGFKFSSRCGILDLEVMEIHIVTNTPYVDAASWDLLFHHLPKLTIIDLTFILQDGPYDESLNCYREKLPLRGFDPKEYTLVYTVYQKPYHMYFSSPEYTEADFVVTYGMSDPKYDAHNKISYRNMTHYNLSVLCLMDSTKELVSKAVKDVKEAQPSSEVLISPQRNWLRAFGAYNSQNSFDADAPNVKQYFAGIHRPSGERIEPLFLNHSDCRELETGTDFPLREFLEKTQGVPEGHL